MTHKTTGQFYDFRGCPGGDNLQDCMDCLVVQLEDRVVLQTLVNSLRSVGAIREQQRLADRLQRIVDSL